MHRRFLEYSLRWQRPVKVMYLEKGQMKAANLTVVELQEDSLLYLSARNRKTPRSLDLDCILAASYARGDDGDTARRLETEREEE